MHRIPLTLLLAASALLPLAPVATAADACDAANPCPLVVDVDETGFVGRSVWNVTMGDNYVLSLSNEDDVAHTVTLSAFGVSVSAPGLSGKDSAAFVASKTGTFELKDSPSGTTASLVVLACDAVDHSAGITESCTTTGKAPGLELPLLLGALAAVAVLRRRA